MKVFNRNTVRVSKEEVENFNAKWPGSKIRARTVTFEFDTRGDLVDHNLTEREDGDEVTALSIYAQEFWARENAKAINSIDFANRVLRYLSGIAIADRTQTEKQIDTFCSHFQRTGRF